MQTWRVTVFGGSSVEPNDPVYREALLLGQLLGAAGFIVQTGGYIGTMEAVSRGAAEAGAHVIGVTCDEIERWRVVGPNPWVKEEHRYPTLRARLMAMIDQCEAALALPGGVGTLAEVAMMWNHLLTSAITPRPLILIGHQWQAMIHQLFTLQGSYIPEKQRTWISLAPDVHKAVERLQELMGNDKLMKYPSLK